MRANPPRRGLNQFNTRPARAQPPYARRSVGLISYNPKCLFQWWGWVAPTDLTHFNGSSIRFMFPFFFFYDNGICSRYFDVHRVNRTSVYQFAKQIEEINHASHGTGETGCSSVDEIRIRSLWPQKMSLYRQTISKESYTPFSNPHKWEKYIYQLNYNVSGQISMLVIYNNILLLVPLKMCASYIN